MASTTENVPHEALTDAIPHYGTYNSRANTRYPEGSIVCKDENGRAYAPVTADVSGYPAQGVSKSYILNATGDANGGLDDSVPVEVMFGVFGFPFTGTTPLPGDDLYVVDNHTLSTDSLNGTRGYAGKCIEVRTTQGLAKAYCLMSPWVGGKGGPGSMFEVNVPLTSFLDPDGDPLAKFADGASAVPGWNLADSEAFGIRWNNHATPNLVLTTVPLPGDIDDNKPIYVDVYASKTGATLADATAFTLTAFLVAVGALHDADANAGGDTAAMVGDAAAKTVQRVSKTIAAADVPANASLLFLTLKPKDGTLGTDDVIVERVTVRGSRK